MTIAVEPVVTVEPVKTAEIDVIVNGRNRVMLDGYVTQLKYDAESKEMYLRLGHISMSKKKVGKVYTTYIDVYFYSYYAAEIARWIHNGMYIEVEAKLRGWQRGEVGREYFEYCLIGAHVTPAKQIMARIPITMSADAAQSR
jgi:hypothetical protein